MSTSHQTSGNTCLRRPTPPRGAVASHAAQRKPPMEIAASFNLDDAAERFMHEVIDQFHTEIPGLYTMHSICRITYEVGGKSYRRVLTVTSFQPRRRGAQRNWKVITWDIDEVHIRFHPYADASAALVALAAMASVPQPRG